MTKRVRNITAEQRRRYRLNYKKKNADKIAQYEEYRKLAKRATCPTLCELAKARVERDRRRQETKVIEAQKRASLKCEIEQIRWRA